MDDWYSNIPLRVRAVLERSWNDYVANVPGTRDLAGVMLPQRKAATFTGHEYVPARVHGNLQNAFTNGRKPTDVVQAIKNIPTAELNMMIIIYEDMRAISQAAGRPPDELWASMKWIRGSWCGTSAGFTCAYEDESARTHMRNLYQSYVGNGLVNENVLSGGDHPGCNTWRQVPPTDIGGLHFILGDELSLVDPDHRWRMDSIHLDWTVPCSPDYRHTCAGFKGGGWLLTLEHVTQAIFGVGAPKSPFYTSVILKDLREKQGTIRAKHGDKGIDELTQLEATWAKSARMWASEGRVGWNKAMSIYQRAEALDAANNP